MPTKKGRTHIAVLLDRSGSMNAIREDARGSYNAYLAEQQEATADEALWSLTLFGGEHVELRHAGVPLAEMAPMVAADYRPRGSTPLYDAMGRTLTALEDAVEAQDRALFVVITDGHENASTEWSHAAVQAKVAELSELGNWTIVYLASTPDAVEIGVGLGIQRSNSVQLAPGDEAEAIRRVSDATLHYRRSAVRSSSVFGESVEGADRSEDAQTSARDDSDDSGPTNGT